MESLTYSHNLKERTIVEMANTDPVKPGIFIRNQGLFDGFEPKKPAV